MKVTTKGKHLLKVGAVVTAISVALSVMTFVVTHPTAKHVDIARQMNAGPEQDVFAKLMSTPEAGWTMYSGMAMALIQFILYIAAIYFVYKYVRKHRLTSNPAGSTTAMFVVASVIALAVSVGIDTAFNVQSLIYSTPAAFIGFAVVNLIISFIMTFLIVVIVEKVYDRKHSFAIE